jgi:hypothetical protein
MIVIGARLAVGEPTSVRIATRLIGAAGVIQGPNGRPLILAKMSYETIIIELMP